MSPVLETVALFLGAMAAAWAALTLLVVRPYRRYRHRYDDWQRQVLDEYQALGLEVWDAQTPVPVCALSRQSRGKVAWWAVSLVAAGAARSHMNFGCPNGEDFQRRLERLATACEALRHGEIVDFDPIPYDNGQPLLTPGERVEAAKALW